ncbi:hypothetical protein SAMN04515648_0948 [Phyllobacterium sp. CL33Tsu]|uniref:Rap1a/Tai family immunity protein n=1 Tax=Phyllobacterium sp. CL33Tsu TaxID=1798191 RepID=UPI0008E107FD|nr:Rap1a/Tai family immunity protein [Phyllobacterium sp. CL33Tsu]SFI64553.1 hypothetical protein SAMN04515648_0948 [Phyllobacterium sp. CL33Tsu]
MRRFLLVAAMVVATSSAQAGFYTGNEMLEMCEAKRGTVDRAICNGFITGVADSMDAIRAWLGIKRQCVPGRVTTGQLVDLLKDYLEKHPAVRHDDAGAIAVLAISEAFCPGKQ